MKQPPLQFRPFLAVVLMFAALLPVAGGALAASDSDWDMEPMRPNLHDKPSLQRGAALYMSFCMGCHSLEHQRYERTADFLEVPHELFWESVVFDREPIGSLMTNAMPIEAPRNWFGLRPPDLTMVTRVRGERWVYNFLKAFYLDELRPFGVNNKVFENTGMPHALIELQGIPREVCRQAGGARDSLDSGAAATGEECGYIETDEGTGLMSEAEFDQAVYDITNFLYYVAEPTRVERERLGIYVILFLVVLLVLTVLLGREYTRGVH